MHIEDEYLMKKKKLPGAFCVTVNNILVPIYMKKLNNILENDNTVIKFVCKLIIIIIV